jgi:hypothetical protein
MKSRWKLIYAAIATTLLLTACGTSPETGNENTNGSTDGVETVDKGTVTENEGTETEVADESTSTDSQVDILKDAQLKDSDEQNYAISVLPDYTLTSEEPGKDSLMATGNEAVFMRIETVKKEEGTYDYLADNMIAVLEASSDGNTPTEVTDAKSIPAGEGIENAKVLSVKAETASITGIIFERDDMVVRLTIYDSPKEEHFERFLRMGETIVSK